jgi:uncharacterized repeat protein (TIGR02543 family)
MSQRNVDVAEAPIHEISHNFDSFRWEFEPEALANFKAYYYFSVTGEHITNCNITQTFVGGDGFKTYIKSHVNRLLGQQNYDASIALGVYSGYGLAYNLAVIADNIGWIPFMDTFRYFDSLSPADVPVTRLGKLNLFLSKLQDFSGQNVFQMFSLHEMSVYENYFNGTIQYTALPVTITWNANRGTVSPATEQRLPGTIFHPMPTPFRSGYVFRGWWTTADHPGESIIGSSIVPSSNTTYYARWEKTLPVIRFEQEQRFWCWAASAQMIGNYLSPSLGKSQTDIATHVKPQMRWTIGALDFEIVQAIAFATGRQASVTPTESYAFHQAVIDSGRPLAARVRWDGALINSHIVVISGYDDANNSLQLIDPWFGCGIEFFEYDLLILGTQIQSGFGQYVRTFVVD